MFGLFFREPSKAVTFRKLYGWGQRSKAPLNWTRYFSASMIVISRKDRGAGPLANQVQSSSIGSSVQYPGSVSTSGRYPAILRS
jgi:hypothetical protein